MEVLTGLNQLNFITKINIMKNLSIIFTLVILSITTSFSKSTYNGKCSKKVIKCIIRK